MLANAGLIRENKIVRYYISKEPLAYNAWIAVPFAAVRCQPFYKFWGLENQLINWENFFVFIGSGVAVRLVYMLP
jgi:hypothetical protein